MKRFFNTQRAEGSQFLTDLAVERHRANTSLSGVEYKISESDVGTWENIKITDEEGARSIGRPIGTYHTLNTGRMDLLSEEVIYDVQDEIARKLCEMTDNIGVLPERILVVGLGNKNLSPDALGPKACEIISPTLHIKEFDEDMFSSLSCSEIAVIIPGVSADTGLDALEVVRGVARRIIPDIIIAIDALASHSAKRLGSTVQISDTGIFPGSGVGNHRQPFNEKTLSTPIISIGIPTVIDTRALVSEDITGEFEGGSMLVAPREIDEITTVGAKIIGGSINQAFGISPYV